MRLMQRYGWPGNIRELKNVVERALILSGDSAVILPRHLAIPKMEEVRDEVLADMDDEAISFMGEPSLEDIKRDYLKYLLERYDGHRGKVARVLGISERNTYRLIGKFGFGEDPGE